MIHQGKVIVQLSAGAAKGASVMFANLLR